MSFQSCIWSLIFLFLGYMNGVDSGEKLGWKQYYQQKVECVEVANRVECGLKSDKINK